MMRTLHYLLLALLAANFVREAAAQVQTWELEPYRVRIAIALDGPELQSLEFRRELQRHLANRIRTGIGPLWRPTLELTDGAELPEVSESPFDKTFGVLVRQSAEGIAIEGYEHDHYLLRSSAIRLRTVANLGEAPEAAFQLIVDAFAPLARFKVRDDGLAVTLQPKGAALPRRYRPEQLLPVGGTLLPLFRRTDYTGALAENGIIPAAWTVLEVADVESASIVSHTPRPFAARRMGRIEQVAILLTNPPAPVTLQLHVEKQPEERLAGYDVFRRRLADQSLTPVGRTNSAGELVIAPEAAAVDLLYIRLGAELVARTPVAYAGDRELVIALPDERPRIAATATVTALREELVDLVARRNILISRIEAQLDAGEADRARELLAELDRLPGRALFEQQLNRAEQLHHSPDARVQRRIEASFAAVRKLLAQFLSNDKSIELGGRLSAAN